MASSSMWVCVGVRIRYVCVGMRILSVHPQIGRYVGVRIVSVQMDGLFSGKQGQTHSNVVSKVASKVVIR